MNANKTEYMCFKGEGAISTLNSRPRKLVDKFIYISSNISSTESDVNICLAKAWIALDKLLIIWKSNQSHNTGFLPSCGCVHTTVEMHHKDTNKTH